MSAPQTVDEVIALVRMRVAYARATSSMFPPSAIAAMADLVEAAAERERETADLRAIHRCHDCERENATPGNAAAMRDALEKLVKAVKGYFGWEDAPAVHDMDGPDAYFCEAVSYALAALAAPARNCDLFNNYAAARAAFDGRIGASEWEVGAWLFSPAKEGGER